MATSVKAEELGLVDLRSDVEFFDTGSLKIVGNLHLIEEHNSGLIRLWLGMPGGTRHFDVYKSAAVKVDRTPPHAPIHFAT
jgi:hypothetical protein